MCSGLAHSGLSTHWDHSSSAGSAPLQLDLNSFASRDANSHSQVTTKLLANVTFKTPPGNIMLCFIQVSHHPFRIKFSPISKSNSWITRSLPMDSFPIPKPKKFLILFPWLRGLGCWEEWDRVKEGFVFFFNNKKDTDVFKWLEKKKKCHFVARRCHRMSK